MWAYQGVLEDGRFNGTMQNVVGPTLVAMATKFGLGAEIQSPTGLYSVMCSVAASSNMSMVCQNTAAILMQSLGLL